MISPYRDDLYDQTHHNAIRVWHQARNGPKYELEQALAFGFAAHNDSWGADYIAHHSGLTNGGSEGYVITKAIMLDNIIEYQGKWDDMGITDPNLRLELCHEIVEVAVDVWIRYLLDPDIGTSVFQATQARDENMKALLQRAFAGNLVAYSHQIGIPLNQPQAAAALFGAEAYFRWIMEQYGSCFMASDIDSVKSHLSDYLAELAAIAYGLTIDPSTVVEFIDGGMLVTWTDFYQELQGTITFVQGQLAAHKVQY